MHRSKEYLGHKMLTKGSLGLSMLTSAFSESLFNLSVALNFQ